MSASVLPKVSLKWCRRNVQTGTRKLLLQSISPRMFFFFLWRERYNFTCPNKPEVTLSLTDKTLLSPSLSPSPLPFLLAQEHWIALSPSEMLVYLKPDLHALTYSWRVSYFSDLPGKLNALFSFQTLQNAGSLLKQKAGFSFIWIMVYLHYYRVGYDQASSTHVNKNKRKKERQKKHLIIQISLFVHLFVLR